MARAAVRKMETSTSLLEAAKKVLRRNGYAGLSTRDVAAEAGVPLSQIHYHFGSKQNMVLALFEYLNAQLLDRQNAMFHDPSLKLSEQWDRACDYLDEDIASGYVRVLQEMIAAGWSNAQVGDAVRDLLGGWFLLLTEVAREAERRHGPLRPFTPAELATLVGTAFLGSEALLLLGFDRRLLPIRSALGRVGVLIREREEGSTGAVVAG